MSNVVLQVPVRFTAKKLGLLLGALAHAMEMLEKSEPRYKHYEDLFLAALGSRTLDGVFYIQDGWRASLAIDALREFRMAVVDHDRSPSVASMLISTSMNQFPETHPAEMEDIMLAIHAEIEAAIDAA